MIAETIWNLKLAWIWILMGMLSGGILGMCFHRPNWLGGYSALPRRMVRLGHISFVALGVINLAFVFTVEIAALHGPLLPYASAGFIVGAVGMPLCCLAMAAFPRVRLLFTAPVVALVLATLLTTMEVCAS